MAELKEWEKTILKLMNVDSEKSPVTDPLPCMYTWTGYDVSGSIQ